jgi:hypothetical protein
MVDIKILTKASTPAAHAGRAYCAVCGSPTSLRFSEEYVWKAGRDTRTGHPIRGLEAVCTTNQKHAPAILGWAYLDVLDPRTGLDPQS